MSPLPPTPPTSPHPVSIAWPPNTVHRAALWPARLARLAAPLALIAVAVTRAAAAPAGIQGAGHTVMAVVNRDAAQSAVVVADFYKQGASAAIPVQISHPGIPPQDARVIADSGQLTNGAYSVIVSSDRAVDVRSLLDWPTSGGALASDSAEAGNVVLLPLAMLKYVGQTSIVSIHNTDTSQVATATVEVHDPSASAGTPIVSKVFVVLPGGGVTLDLAKDPAFVQIRANSPYGFLGSMRIVSASMLAVEMFIDNETRPRIVYSYSGIPDDAGALRLHVPLVVQDAVNADVLADISDRSLIAVQNAAAVDATATVRFHGVGGTCAGADFTYGPRTLPPAQMTLFDSSVPGIGTSGPGLPFGCIANARVEADAPVVAAVVLMRERLRVGPRTIEVASAANALRDDAATTAWLAWPWERTGAA